MMCACSTSWSRSGAKDSHTFNPFAIGNADAIRELLASQLGEQAQNDANGVFRERAVALIGTITPVLVWLRDHKGVALNIEAIRFAIELRWIWKLAIEKIVLLRDPETGTVTELDVSGEIPEDITWPLRAYLGELPGFDPTMPLDKQKGDEPSKQHGFAQFYFTATFTQLAVSLGHIFRVECGDIDMRDMVLNRRILVVNLPALENSDATLAALGKLVVASLRAMMAQLLGGSARGRPTPRPTSPAWGRRRTTSCRSTSWPTTRPAASTACWPWAAGSISCFMLGFQEVVGHLGPARREDRIPARQRQPDDRHAPAGQRTHARVDREDRRADLRHPGDILSGRRRRRLPGGAARRGSPGLSRATGTICIADRGRGDRPVRRPAHLRPRVPRQGRRFRTQAPRPDGDADARRTRERCGSALRRTGRDGRDDRARRSDRGGESAKTPPPS